MIHIAWIKKSHKVLYSTYFSVAYCAALFIWLMTVFGQLTENYAGIKGNFTTGIFKEMPESAFPNDFMWVAQWFGFIVAFWICCFASVTVFGTEEADESQNKEVLGNMPLADYQEMTPVNHFANEQD